MGDLKITIHMVASLDGFIAKKDNSVSWFETKDRYEDGVGGEDVEGFMKTIDYFIMGSHTYELAAALAKDYGWAYGDVPTIVLSSRNLQGIQKNIEIYAGDVEYLVNERLANCKNVWLVGGAMLTKEFIRLKLADEIRMSILPIILGDGLLFFDYIGQEQALHLKSVKTYKTGMVELGYEIKK